ncbi:potassium voltage-gated channel subfamily S member 3-like [Clupea harengus]|uniref:Potassium voltage-gated channel subfamily S member 3-like n=1 Tax=Clupea harengus TaxID=7950 RepID=A0A6P8GQB3_CLUHA|nr:potassium voltage-gated channel subfamily S member 3-like [Clupea harengus]XP_031437608.1 potassium voltage-gated channel subfamily S member 3-like [Clupea harengus]
MEVHSMPEFQRVDANDRPIEDPVLAILEVICIICFSAEYSMRLVVAPSPRKFLEKPLNIIDFVSILPFYLTLAFETIDEEGSEEESENLENVRKVVHVLRLMHIFRILKLARHSVRLRALGATMRHSYEEVGLLILFLSIGISIFFCAHLLGREGECRLRPQHHPCRLVLGHHPMTTVGYGDTCPVTTAGKVVATLCST